MIQMIRDLISALNPNSVSEIDRELKRERARYRAEAAAFAATIRRQAVDRRSLLMEEMIRHPEPK